MFEYLATLLVFTIPLVVYGFTQKQFRQVLIKVGIIATPIGVVWDYLAVHYLKLWSFNPDTLLGVWLLGLPLEEWLFCLLVSMAVSTLALIVALIGYRLSLLEVKESECS